MHGTAFNAAFILWTLHLTCLLMFHLFFFFLHHAVVATPCLESAAALGDGRDSTVTRAARLDTTGKHACCRAAAAMELTVTQSQVPVCAPLGSWWVHHSCQWRKSIFFYRFVFRFWFDLYFVTWFYENNHTPVPTDGRQGKKGAKKLLKTITIRSLSNVWVLHFKSLNMICILVKWAVTFWVTFLQSCCWLQSSSNPTSLSL